MKKMVMRLRIRELLDKRKWSGNQLAKETKIRSNTLYELEKDLKTSWKIEHLIALMKAFELKNINELIEYVEVDEEESSSI